MINPKIIISYQNGYEGDEIFDERLNKYAEFSLHPAYGTDNNQPVYFDTNSINLSEIETSGDEPMMHEINVKVIDSKGKYFYARKGMNMMNEINCTLVELSIKDE